MIKHAAPRGFSLVEMLVVIAVIGVAAAIAIPNIGSVGSSARVATAQRNAQSIVSMYEYGTAAGIVWGGADRNAKIQSVITGASPTDGPFAGKSFKLPNLSTADTQATYPYIGFDGTDLYYDKAGAQASS
jgi:prepilin-type N-terminal cleavage/methylation domain-containing protein